MHYYFKSHAVPKSMPKQEREALLMELKNLLKVAKMEDANFSDGKEDLTEYLRERTRLYRESWLISPIENLIKRYEAD